MAKISLRDYLSGIEELIDQRRIEDALAHCRHILTHFPKNVATYRMIGKAFLEAHQHTEANDIFQRVLSSCPDDFVSHIGMSIIREEAGDLDGSIWNMERAFEAQPSNRPVQDELRRLYGKREGYAPPKVRLTRGALARMYAHGDLYNQAIGELRSALAEDGQRPDLQVLLAEMYFKTKRETDAIEVCTALIEKLPYCLYANRVMVDILRGSQREVEAKPYLERVEELDPYAAHVDTMASVDSVPADIVMLEQLVMEAPEAKGQPIPKAWTGSLEMESTGFEKEELPEWLSVESIGEPPAKEETEEPAKKTYDMLESLESLEPIPTSELETPRTKSSGQALSEDQIPEWLRELRPSTTSLTEGDQQPSSDEQLEPIPQEPHAEEEQELAREKTPAFLSEDLQEETQLVTAETSITESPVNESPAEDDESLSWLEKLAAQQGAPEEELLTTPEDREAAKPDWLPQAKQEETPQSEVKGKRDVLAWLDEMAAQQGAPETEKVPVEPAAEPTAPFEKEDEVEIPGTTPTWLKDLSAEIEEGHKTGEAADEIAPRPLEEAPDWLSELRPVAQEAESAEGVVEEEIRAEADKPKTAEELSKQDWLEELGPPKLRPAESEWVPETRAAGTGGEEPLGPPVSVPVVSPRRTATLKAEQEAPGRLEQARQALNFGKLDDAADQYGYLLRRRLLIKDVIADLDAAVHRHPADATLWQTLGDAYMRNNQLREALDCYTRAEDLL